jgi:ubiquinone/menaquinone biosynthesis C-methylase UbiE
MGFYAEQIYPRLVSRLGNPEPIRKLRKQIVLLARGIVLEVGVGSGANLTYYDPARVSLLYALEPNAGMLRLAEVARRQTDLTVRFLDLPGERIPLDDGSVDTVVSTFTLCTIPAIVQAIRGIARVLKPGGTLIFLEHSIAADPRVQRWQQMWEPIHHWVFEGLHLTRDIPALLASGGFRVEQSQGVYVTRFPKAWGHCCCGTAIPE